MSRLKLICYFQEFDIYLQYDEYYRIVESETDGVKRNFRDCWIGDGATGGDVNVKTPQDDIRETSCQHSNIQRGIYLTL